MYGEGVDAPTLPSKPLDWQPAALDVAEQFGLDVDAVEAIVRHPDRVAIDPSSATRDWEVLRYSRGDVSVVVGFPHDMPPRIWGVYLRLPMEGTGEKQGTQGAGSTSGSQVPKTMRALRRRIVEAGLKIHPGGSHDRVETEDGQFIAALPITPSDHRTIPNVWTAIRRKGYEV